MCAPMFTAALFTEAKMWKQPKCLSLDDSVKKCGLEIQRSTIQPQERRALEGIMLRETSLTEKDKYRMILLLHGI